jgi:hypothetical protein
MGSGSRKTGKKGIHAVTENLLKNAGKGKKDHLWIGTNW